MRAIVIGLASIVAAALPSAATAQQFTMKLSSPTINDVTHEYYKTLKAGVEKRAGGRLKLEIYPANQLGQLPVVVEGVALGTIEVGGRSFDVPTGEVTGECTVFARPERLRVVDAGEGLLQGTVGDVVFVGSTTHIRVAIPDGELQIVVSNDGTTRVPTPGSVVGVDIPVDAIRLLPR